MSKQASKNRTKPSEMSRHNFYHHGRYLAHNLGIQKGKIIGLEMAIEALKALQETVVNKK